jgi:hypothetical protein
MTEEEDSRKDEAGGKPPLFENMYVTVPMPDGLWGVPVRTIVNHRVAYYAPEGGMEYGEALKETLELFESDDYDIVDWALNNMDWGEVESAAVKLREPEEFDRSEFWSGSEDAKVEEHKNVSK